MTSSMHLIEEYLGSKSKDHRRSPTGCVGCPSTMDCSHSMAEEETAGQIGGVSYTAPEWTLDKLKE